MGYRALWVPCRGGSLPCCTHRCAPQSTATRLSSGTTSRSCCGSLPTRGLRHSSVHAARRTLFDACCVSRMFTHAARCTLYDACCPLHAARVMSRHNVHSTWCMVHRTVYVALSMLHVACCMLHVACCTLRWMYGELHDWRYPNEPKLYTIHQRQGGYANKATHLHQDWTHPGHICIGTGLTPATFAPGLGSLRPHLHRDWAQPLSSGPDPLQYGGCGISN